MRCRKTGTRQAFAIIVKDEFTGVCALYDIERTARKAKLYYWVAVAYWNKGIASKALQQLIAYAKDELHIKYVETGVLALNIASIRVLEKNGFLFKKMLINTGQYHQKFEGEKIIEMKRSL